MHEIYDGPLKRLLERHLKGKHAALIHVQGVNIPDGIKDELKLGSLQEDFEICGLQGEEEGLEKTMLRLIEKLYGCINLTLRGKVECGTCKYCLKGKDGGIGVLLTYTFGRGARELSVTCQNFEF
jgi:hypothetical protein